MRKERSSKEEPAFTASPAKPIAPRPRIIVPRNHGMDANEYLRILSAKDDEYMGYNDVGKPEGKKARRTRKRIPQE